MTTSTTEFAVIAMNMTAQSMSILVQVTASAIHSKDEVKAAEALMQMRDCIKELRATAATLAKELT